MIRSSKVTKKQLLKFSSEIHLAKTANGVITFKSLTATFSYDDSLKPVIMYTVLDQKQIPVLSTKDLDEALKKYRDMEIENIFLKPEIEEEC